MNGPNRYDLEETSCMNKEVKVYNRKLNNIKRRYNYTEVTDMSADRDHYTKHGLHMNGIGKDWLARRIANTINKLFVNHKLAPIILEWKESSERNN
jgi:hypothetical protein